jgi:hypothetical protein
MRIADTPWEGCCTKACKVDASSRLQKAVEDYPRWSSVSVVTIVGPRQRTVRNDRHGPETGQIAFALKTCSIVSLVVGCAFIVDNGVAIHESDNCSLFQSFAVSIEGQPLA